MALTVGACVLSLAPGALAAETRPLVGSFGIDGTAATSFGYPDALTFDQSSQDLYVLDQAASSVYGFDVSTPATQTPLASPFPLAVSSGGAGWEDDLAVDSSSHNLYFVSENIDTLFGFAASGSPLSGFPVTGFGDSCGAAVDPNGNVWVGDFAAEQIKEFNPSGGQIGSVDTSGQGTPCHIAFDDAGDLYVALWNGATFEYTQASGYTSASQIDPGPTVALAVDRSTGTVFVAHPDHVSAYDSSGSHLYDFGGNVSGASYRGIAVDQATNEVYVSDAAAGEVRAFGPPVPLPGATTLDADGVTDTAATVHGTVVADNVALTDCHFDYGTTSSYGQTAPCVPGAGAIAADSSDHAVSAALTGLTPGGTYHFRLVAANANGATDGADRTFTTALGAPAVTAQSVSEVGTTEATVTASINPQGAPTTYHVDYGPSSGYGQSTPESGALGVAGDDSGHTVSVHVPGLAAGVTYHFRFVAQNVVGSTPGPDTTFSTYAAAPSFGPCPNDAFRTGPAAALPDCRAYEQVSPVDKNGSGIQHTINVVQASPAGDRFTFADDSGLPTTGGTPSPAVYVASRGPSGWSTNGLLPQATPGYQAELLAWSPDISTSFSDVQGGPNGGLWLGDTASGTWTQPVAAQPAEPRVADFASDPQHVIFEDTKALVSGAVAGVQNLYDLDHGALTLVGRVPAGSATSCDDASAPACVPAPEGSFAGPYDFLNSDLDRGGATSAYYTQNTLSADGSKVFFTEAGTGRLFMRENGTTTVQMNASQASSPDPNGPKPAAWMAATPSGSEALFTSCARLTDNSTAVSTAASGCAGQGSDLYSYDTATGELTDLTVDSNGDPLGADVLGVLGISDDGSDVYFAANGVLAGGATEGNCAGSSGSCSLYVRHDGVTTFLGRVPGTDGAIWEPQFQVGATTPKASRVTGGGTLVFASKAQLTPYDNQGQSEIYRYSPGGANVTCVSCDPTGAAPVGGATLESRGDVGDVFSAAPAFVFLTRNVSADGDRVFFDTPDALVAADTNGAQGCPIVPDTSSGSCTDVYEWEADGSGSCSSTAQDGGCLYLISTGKSPNPSFLGDVSASGNDVFFFTEQQLVGQDQDQLVDAYDARVDGGLASQQQPPSQATCEADACKAGVTVPPPPPTAATVAFAGPADATAARRPAAKATVLTHAVRGNTFALRVRTPGKGRIAITGNGIAAVHKRVSRAGTYRLRVSLTADAKRKMARRDKLTLNVHVSYTPAGAAAVPATVRITVTPPPRPRARGRVRSRAAGHGQRGAR